MIIQKIKGSPKTVTYQKDKTISLIYSLQNLICKWSIYKMALI